MKKRNKRIVRSSGYKKKKVIVPRKKLRKRGGSCKTEDDNEFLSLRTQRRRTGRTIRKARRMAKNPEPMHAVK